MIGVNELLEFLMILLIIGCAIGWIIIGTGMLKCRIGGKCPKDRTCKNSGCRWRIWCEKYQRYSDKFKYLSEILRETEEKEKKKRS